MHMSLDFYRVFYFVAQCRSISRAAEMLYSNQPNVTRTIKNLEQALGCKLFIRSNRGVTLTPEGEKLYAHISTAMEQIQTGEQALRSAVDLESGTISIGVTEIALHRVLLPILERFQKKYPGIHLRIFNSGTQQAVSSLKDRLVDFSLITPPADLPKNFQQIQLCTFQEVPVCGTAYRELAGQTLSVAELTHYPLVSLCKGTSTHQLYSDWFHSLGLTFSPDVEAATADQILPMVRSNLGLGFIPAHTAEEAIQNGDVFRLSLDINPPERSICLLLTPDIPLGIAARELISRLVDFTSGNSN